MSATTTAVQRRWRPNGTRPLPSAEEALAQPFRAFPSWFLRIECGRCGQAWIMNEAQAPQHDVLLADLLAHARHEGCGGQATKAELLNTTTRVGGRPVRRIVLRGS
jgi:hypothetical protein